ncbi:phosphopantetheine-binding protein [Kitasatospora sp. NPDC048343]|uniref:phosphopantetheine-binding protein n=1 Tax=Kitasatospora sp. NPDC048343 TaxID=3154717 RepID=UPI0033FC1661
MVERIRAEVADLLGEDPADIPLDENLVDWGLDSIRLMTLAERWRAEGVRARPLRLIDHPFERFRIPAPRPSPPRPSRCQWASLRSSHRWSAGRSRRGSRVVPGWEEYGRGMGGDGRGRVPRRARRGGPGGVPQRGGPRSQVRSVEAR